MATTVPTMLTSSTQESVLKELDEATSELLHLSLDIHTPQHTSPNRSGVRMGSNRARRRKSVEELRVARNIIDDLTTVSSRADNCEEGRSSRHATARPDAGMRSTTEPPWNISTSNQQLLRRVTSADDLLIAGDEQDDEDDFSSDDEPFRMRPPSIASSTTSQRSSRLRVRLEDRSDRECDAFARDVRIRGFHSVGAQNAGGFVVFDIEIITRDGALMRIHKRYSAFSKLRGQLMDAFPHLRPLLPRLPPKSTLSKFRTSFLERRRQQLGFWLNTVLLHPEIGSSVYVRQWVLE